MKVREYTVETRDQVPLHFFSNKYFAVFKCIVTKKAVYVFEFEWDENGDYELVDCIFNKERWKIWLI